MSLIDLSVLELDGGPLLLFSKLDIENYYKLISKLRSLKWSFGNVKSWLGAHAFFTCKAAYERLLDPSPYTGAQLHLCYLEPPPFGPLPPLPRSSKRAAAALGDSTEPSHKVPATGPHLPSECPPEERLCAAVEYYRGLNRGGVISVVGPPGVGKTHATMDVLSDKEKFPAVVKLNCKFLDPTYNFFCAVIVEMKLAEVSEQEPEDLSRLTKQVRGEVLERLALLSPGPDAPRTLLQHHLATFTVIVLDEIDTLLTSERTIPDIRELVRLTTDFPLLVVGILNKVQVFTSAESERSRHVTVLFPPCDKLRLYGVLRSVFSTPEHREVDLRFVAHRVACHNGDIRLAIGVYSSAKSSQGDFYKTVMSAVNKIQGVPTVDKLRTLPRNLHVLLSTAVLLTAKCDDQQLDKRVLRHHYQNWYKKLFRDPRVDVPHFDSAVSVLLSLGLFTDVGFRLVWVAVTVTDFLASLDENQRVFYGPLTQRLRGNK